MRLIRWCVAALVLHCTISSMSAQEPAPTTVLRGNGLIFSSFCPAKGLLLTVENSYQVNLWYIKDRTHRIILPNVRDIPYHPYHVSIDLEGEKFVYTLNHNDRRDSTRILVYNCDSAEKEVEFEVSGHVKALHAAKLAFTLPKDKPGPLTVVDLRTRKTQTCEVPLTKTSRIVPSPDGKRVVVIGHEGLVCYKVKGGLERLWTAYVPRTGAQIFFSPDSKVLAHRTPPHTYLYDAATGKEKAKLWFCGALCFSPSGREFITLGTGEFQAYPVDQATPKLPEEWPLVRFDARRWRLAYGPFRPNTYAYLDKEGVKLLACGQSGEIRIWSVDLKRKDKKLASDKRK